MNGLKYIRTRCNLSLIELADMIGVSRQALSSWENGRKDIPEQRLDQLAEFFGVNREFLGEISDEMKNDLIDKAMFRYDENGKEYYRFRPQEGVTSLDQTRVSFFFDNSQKSLDEEYILARHKKQEMLEAIKNIIKWTENAGSISAQIVCINRGCYVYGMINEMMEEMKKKDAHLKMPFFYELVDVWKAMLVAYGIIDKEEISKCDRKKSYCGEDREWILELSKQIKEHWDTEYAYCEEYRKDVQNKLKAKETELKETKSLEEQITDIENDRKEFIMSRTLMEKKELRDLNEEYRGNTGIVK